MRAMREPLVVADVELRDGAGGSRLSARVRDPEGVVPDPIWFEIPSPLARAVADPFLLLLAPVAMQRRRPIRIDGSVSPGLLETVPKAMEVFARWSHAAGEGYPAVPVEASARHAHGRGAAAGAFFSAGVDSFYTLVRNHDRYPHGDSRRITRLIVMHGYDLRLEQAALFDRLHAEAGRVADRVGAEVAAVRTNGRAALAGLPWNRYGYGPMQAAVAHALGAGLHTVYLPSAGRPFTEMAMHDSSANPELCAWWSTEALELVYDPVHLTRAEKVAYLGRHPWALRHLRVCWENRGDTYNCGRCEKCVRTMLELAVAGMLGEAAGQFPAPLSPELIRSVSIPPRLAAYWTRLAGTLGAAPAEAAVVRAIEERLAESRWLDSPAGRLDAAVSRVLARLGLTAARVKAVDRRLTGGAASAWFRRWRRSG